VARRATVIRSERAEAGHILVLDAGDSLVGDTDPARSTHGLTSVQAMNLMGYDAMALGMGDASLLGLTELARRIDEAQFAVLSANAYVAKTRKLVTDPYLLLAMDDHRVAILGLTDAGAAGQVVATDPLAAARDWVPRLRPLADIIIVLSHAGMDIDKVIAEQVEGIDLMVSGRRGMLTRPIFAEATGTILLHADYAAPGHAGTRLGVTRLSFDKSGGLTQYGWQRIPLTKTYEDDPEMATWVRTALSTDAGGCD